MAWLCSSSPKQRHLPDAVTARRVAPFNMETAKLRAQLLLIALGTTVFLANAANAATNYIIVRGNIDTSYADLDLVRAESDGEVVIHDYRRGQIGEVLGSAPVHAGANADVRVRFGVQPRGDVIAILVDQFGTEVTSTVIGVDR
jgi:hypothetical protein